MRAILNVAITDNVLTLFFLCAAIHYPSWTTIASVPVAFFISAALTTIAAYVTSLRNATDMLRTLFRGDFTSQNLSRIPHQSVLECLPTAAVRALDKPATFRLGVLRQGAGLDGAFESLVTYVRSFSSGAFDPLLKAYVSGVGTSMIFLRDVPSPQQRPYARFKLLHEVAHVSMNGTMLAVYHRRRLLAAAAIVAMSLWLVQGHWMHLLAGGMVALIAWIRFTAFPVLCETRADNFALKLLSEEELGRVHHLAKLDWCAPSAPPSTRDEQLRQLLNKTRFANLDAFVRSKPRRKRFADSWNDPPDLLWFLSTAAVLLLGSAVPPITRTQLMALVVIYLVLQIVVGGFLHVTAGRAQRVTEWVVRRIEIGDLSDGEIRRIRAIIEGPKGMMEQANGEASK